MRNVIRDISKRPDGMMAPGSRGEAVGQTVRSTSMLMRRRRRRQKVGECPRQDSSQGAGDCDNGDVSSSAGLSDVAILRRRVRRRIQRSDDGSEIVDESFARTCDEEEARCEPPHRAIVEELTSLLVQEPGLLTLFFKATSSLLFCFPAKFVNLPLAQAADRSPNSPVVDVAAGCHSFKELATVEQSTLLEFFDGFVNKLFFVYDPAKRRSQ